MTASVAHFAAVQYTLDPANTTALQPPEQQPETENEQEQEHEQTAARVSTITHEEELKEDICMGNRRIRIFISCLLLLTFGIFAAGYLFLSQQLYSDNKDSVIDFYGQAYHAYNLIVSGLIFIMAFSVITILLCRTKQNRITGVGLIVGGALYLSGWIFFITVQKDFIYEGLSDNEKEDWDAIWLGHFGEALLYAGTAILLGIDVLFQLFDNEGKRLVLNSVALCAVSILTMPAYFILGGNDNVSGGIAIGIGYIFISLSTLIYIILYVLTGCNDDVNNNKYVRMILCISLCGGGVVAAMGYWFYASNDGGKLGSAGDEAKKVAFYVGYTILVAGLCVIWALDIAWDDDRGKKLKQCCCKNASINQ